ncbi:hypothetical protein M9H77_23004 [Catharanthus roseus]|uniref:Uncharacterized protein n=1 Tax=Catharanthus roseus TaxID=4058 RepID=A0ACC0ASR4_CATRO|nr:hypothetical protein M9H77_23004 [Catharanthus roseus]
MAPPWQLRSYHTPMTGTLDGIGESHGCTSEIQLIVIPVRLDTNFHVAGGYHSECMISISGTLGCTLSQHDIQQTFPVQASHRRPWEPVPDRGGRGVKKGARRLPGRRARGGRLLSLLFQADLGHKVERGEGSRAGHTLLDQFNSPNLDIPSISLV